MAEFTIRAGHNDHLVVADLLSVGSPVYRTHRSRMRRVVVDITAAHREPRFARAATAAGVQLLVDPQTPLLQGQQGPTDTWARLPHATPDQMTIADYQTVRSRARLIEASTQVQLDAGATAIIPPYLYMPEPTGTAADVQEALLRETAEMLSRANLDLPIFPVLATRLSGTALDQNGWRAGLGHLIAVAHDLAGHTPTGLALSASATPQSEHAVHNYATAIRRAQRKTPIIAWRAGDMGPFAIALGAAGYEAGLGRKEHCDYLQERRNREPRQAAGPAYGFAGVYAEQFNTSIATNIAKTLLTVPTLRGDLVCTDPACCARGAMSQTGDGRRQHAAAARMNEIAAVDQIASQIWRLHHIQQQANTAEAAVPRINAAARKLGLPWSLHQQRYRALAAVAGALRATAARKSA